MRGDEARLEYGWTALAWTTSVRPPKKAISIAATRSGPCSLSSASASSTTGGSPFRTLPRVPHGRRADRSSHPISPVTRSRRSLPWSRTRTTAAGRGLHVRHARRAGLDRRDLDARGIREDQVLDGGQYLSVPVPHPPAHADLALGVRAGRQRRPGTSTVISRTASTASMRVIAARCTALTSSAETSAGLHDPLRLDTRGPRHQPLLRRKHQPGPSRRGTAKYERRPGGAPVVSPGRRHPTSLHSESSEGSVRDASASRSGLARDTVRTCAELKRCTGISRRLVGVPVESRTCPDESPRHASLASRFRSFSSGRWAFSAFLATTSKPDH